ncbi:TWiK family of potassium channels protein 7 [Tribolium madens]|uniref:TWiK family of potassium channels protein 7 n=1 Tax=Tribolium madens TaxID=41895 RepID=UPI001CF7345C|nr:TWiK family of potassium channels protein 7 [Tribolium madens]XP_044260255.1 TWiK family of potassium channels protein 7 [Tribolium madens]XP_044260256.1 TWiK family of potassium channels protein 7 [Tribolium madens]XP_044260257.1 TWiK family of potassium channels protein 7 [Tribolium madens]
MEKDSHYCYEPYQKSNSLKRDTKKKTTESCRCFGKSRKSRTKAFFTGLATNLGICILLFGYTLIGSVIFLAIEGGSTFQHSTQILATTSGKKFLNHSAEFKAKNDEARARTVENIWDITVNLNILYRDNWTRLAAQEITRFQDELLKSLGEELAAQPVQEKAERRAGDYEWTFAKAFLYSLTVLTTIGYGSIAPRTTLGKAVTMGYAMLGIPLTLLYLSSIGSILSRVARGVFSRALCCCLCSNCGYCCYDEKRMAEKERRMKKKRQQMELQQQMALQEPFYVRSNSIHNSLHSPIRDGGVKEIDSLSTDNESKSSMHGLSILAPILLCLAMMFIYICLGTFALYKLENWSILDGFYFCFMSLTTIGFGDMVPGSDPFGRESNTTIWFCSIYIMSGMALTAMCFNVVHDEIVHRLKHQEKITPKVNSTSFTDDLNSSDPYNMTS